MADWYGSQGPDSDFRDASDCAPDNHSWDIVYEGANPDANQPCACGARIWNSEGEWCRTGKRSRARLSPTGDEQT